MPDTELERLISAWLDGRLSESESLLLQQKLQNSAEARKTFRDFANLDAVIRSIADGDFDTSSAADTRSNLPAGSSAPIAVSGWPVGAMMWAQWSLAALATVVVGWTAYQMGKSESSVESTTMNVAANDPFSQEHESQVSESSERTIAGYATLRRVAGIRWSETASSYREGDVLSAGILEFREGVAEIDFFCGATVVVEGPAKLELESDWSVRLLAGRLRANVPPAARGFTVKAADSEIVDLGTEFALKVGPKNVQVEVVDGEIKLRGGEHDGDHLFAGETQSLLGEDSDQGSLKDLSTIVDVQRRHETEQGQRFEKWKAYSHKLRLDQRLVAYYPIAESVADRFVPNATKAGAGLDGKIVGLVSRNQGRFGSESNSLGFYRPGSRVRALVDGEFDALTFACWVKIDSLEHLYSALFMSDGYENGEPHWQICEDGRLMLSVMVDDTPGSGLGKEPDARLHQIYYTEPIWDVSMTGQWLHVASVYDPAARVVKQYLNGQQVGSEEITDQYYVKKLRIGAAEIGNWGQPFRKSPEFAVRNLNGAIDELAIFGAALDANDILSLYEQGKPFGY